MGHVSMGKALAGARIEALALCAGAIHPGWAQSTAPVLTAVDADGWLDSMVPGAVVVLVKDGQVLASKAYGRADWEKSPPVEPQRPLFGPGSASKLFTWTAVMQSVEQAPAPSGIGLDFYQHDIRRFRDILPRTRRIIR